MAGQPGFFDSDERLRALSAAGDRLERLVLVVDFEVFRVELEAALSRSDRSRGGRPPYDPVVMFKVLVLQTLYTLSDDQTEYQLRDRLSFMRFVGLALPDPAPDAKTIWLYREQLARVGAVERLFARFDAILRAKGWLAMGGQIPGIKSGDLRDGDRGPPAAIDPRPRRTPSRVASIPCRMDGAAAPRKIHRRRSAGLTSAGASARPRPIKLPATSASRRSRCRCSGTRTTSASTASTVSCGAMSSPTQKQMTAVNSAQCSIATTPPAMCGPIPPTARQRTWPCSTAAASSRSFSARSCDDSKMPAHIARGNATRARVRSRVEHVFAAQKCRLGLIVRTVGMVRARAKIGMANLVYNFTRLAGLQGRTAPGATPYPTEIHQRQTTPVRRSTDRPR